MKFAFFDAKPYDIPAFEKYSAKGNVTFKYYDTRLTSDTAGLCRGFDGVCIFVNDEIDREVIDTLLSFGVKLIALRCAGYNNVDTEYAEGKIALVRVPAYSPYAVAEHAMGMLLTSVRRIHKAYIRTRYFNFSLDGLCGFDLHGKTVGIIGTGKIGRVFADICRGFGTEVIAYDPYPAKDSGISYVGLEELFGRSDVISLHCPLTDETYHIVDDNAIRMMKKGVMIINTSRGALIDARTLLDGIMSRKVGGACLDVYEEESGLFFEDKSAHIPEDDTLTRLISMPNVLVTSHQAFLTEEALDNIAETTVSNIVSYFKDGFSKNEICARCDNIFAKK